MVKFLTEGLLSVKWIPRLESIRFRRVNVQRPRAPHYERAKYLELVKPIYEEDKSVNLPPSLTCQKKYELQKKNLTIDNPLERIIAKELYERVETSQMVGFLHVNPITIDDQFQARILLKRQGMDIEQYSNQTVARAFKGTIYEAILPLFVVHNAIVFSKESQADKLLKVIKKIPQYVLLAGIIDKRLLNVNQLKKYSEIKDITTARAGLVGVLNCFGQNIVNNLTAHQRNLATQLQMYAEIKSKDKENT